MVVVKSNRPPSVTGVDPIDDLVDIAADTMLDPPSSRIKEQAVQGGWNDHARVQGDRPSGESSARKRKSSRSGLSLATARLLTPW